MGKQMTFSIVTISQQFIIIIYRFVAAAPSPGPRVMVNVTTVKEFEETVQNRLECKAWSTIIAVSVCL